MKGGDMEITWFSNKKSSDGVVTLTDVAMTFNSSSSLNLLDAYRVQIGLSKDAKSLLVKPLSRDAIEKGVYAEDTLFKVQTAKTYAKISNVEIMRSLNEHLSLNLDKKGKKYKVSYDEEMKSLVIDLEGGEVK
ncbi:MAG: hypothetical protein K5694_00175 [Bacilli bacterium]|nr:hypothetical protein [Bacilli bacterium]